MLRFIPMAKTIYTLVSPLTSFCSFCKSRLADLVSSFLAAMCRAGNLTLPLESCSSSTDTTLSCPCCKATAKGVNPSYKKISRLNCIFVFYNIIRLIM